MVMRVQITTRSANGSPLATPCPNGSGAPVLGTRDRQVANPRGRDCLYTYKVLRWGSLLSLVALNWGYLTDDGEPDPDDPHPPFLGARQWRWLQDALRAERDATHRVILNQKNMGQLGGFTLPSQLVEGAEALGIPAAQTRELTDVYPGWQGDRRRLYAFLREEGIIDNVVLTGDSHGWWAYDLVEDATPPDYNPIDPWAGTRLTPVGVELIVGMGRPGLTDVAAELAAEAVLGAGQEHSALGAGPVYRTVFRPPFVPPVLAVESAAMTANPNMRYMNWREYGHTMVHLYRDRSVLELLASPPDRSVPAGEGDGSADTVLARYASEVGRPHLAPLPRSERTVGTAKPAVPAPQTVRSAGRT
jgi:alkaline phosphatase D